MSTAVNPYEMSMEELARLSAGVALPTPDQPRDEKGRFTAVAVEPEVVEPEAVVEAPIEPAVEPVVVEDTTAPVEVYTATIDLGDGSGVQVFEGATKDELLQKLITAQENATRKIRELTAKPTPTPVVEATFNPDLEAELAQEFLSEPSKAFDKLYQKRRQEELQREAEANRQAEEAGRAEVQAANTFMAANPEYHKCESNAHKIDKVVRLNGWAMTTENMQKAYDELKADGLLTAKPVTVAPPGPRSSGISVRRAIPTVAPTEADALKKAYEMPLDKLFEAAGGYHR